VKGSHINVKVVRPLLRVGRDDFQILPVTERDERVPCTGAGVAASRGRFHSGHSLNPGNSPIQISNTEKQMIHSSACGYQVFTSPHRLSEEAGHASDSAQAEQLAASHNMCVHFHFSLS
jgi:hypothetical protein